MNKNILIDFISGSEVKITREMLLNRFQNLVEDYDYPKDCIQYRVRKTSSETGPWQYFHQKTKDEELIKVRNQIKNQA